MTLTSAFQTRETRTAMVPTTRFDKNDLADYLSVHFNNLNSLSNHNLLNHISHFLCSRLNAFLINLLFLHQTQYYNAFLLRVGRFFYLFYTLDRKSLLNSSGYEELLGG